LFTYTNKVYYENARKEIIQRLENGGSIRNIAFNYNNYYNINKLKICDYFYDVLVAREEKNKKISKEENQTEVLSESQTAEEVQKIFDDLEEYYDAKEKDERKNEEIWEAIFEKLKNGATSLQISVDLLNIIMLINQILIFMKIILVMKNIKL
jgi:septin family protein